MLSHDREVAEKYDLVPVFTEDKVDGSDVVTVDWASVHPVLESLTAQLQAAQATIAEINARLDVMTHPYSDERIPKVKERDSIRGLYGDGIVDDLEAILSRADTSAHDAAILAAKAEGCDAGIRLVYRDPGWPLADYKALNPYRASIEQTEAE